MFIRQSLVCLYIEGSIALNWYPAISSILQLPTKFSNILLGWKSFCFDSNFTLVYTSYAEWQEVSIVPGNVLGPNRNEAIASATDGPPHRRIYTPFGIQYNIASTPCLYVSFLFWQLDPRLADIMISRKRVFIEPSTFWSIFCKHFKHIEAETKLSFCRRHFQMHLLE